MNIDLATMACKYSQNGSSFESTVWMILCLFTYIYANIKNGLWGLGKVKKKKSQPMHVTTHTYGIIKIAKMGLDHYNPQNVKMYQNFDNLVFIMFTILSLH